MVALNPVSVEPVLDIFVKMASREPNRGDIFTVYHLKEGVYSNYELEIKSAVHPTNTLGYCPIVSTVTGGLQALYGLAQVIVNIARKVFCKGEPTNQMIGNGVKNLIRGAVVIVPVVGNLLVWTVDKLRIMAIEGEIKRKLHEEDDASAREGANKPFSTGAYINGKVIHQSNTPSLNRFTDALQNRLH